MQCGDGPEHGREEAAEAEGLLSHTKAKLKLRREVHSTLKQHEK